MKWTKLFFQMSRAKKNFMSYYSDSYVPFDPLKQVRKKIKGKIVKLSICHKILDLIMNLSPIKN